MKTLTSFYVNHKLPVASYGNLGTVKIGDRLHITSSGLLSTIDKTTFASYASRLSNSFTLTLNGAINGEGVIWGNENVTISTTANYPLASKSTKGLVQIGDNINVINGVISVTFPDNFEKFPISNSITENSSNAVTSGAVYNALQLKIDMPQSSLYEDGAILSKNGNTVKFRSITKNLQIPYDSNSLITAQAVYNALINKQDKLPNGNAGQYLQKTSNGYTWNTITISCDEILDSNSINAIANKTVYDALQTQTNARQQLSNNISSLQNEIQGKFNTPSTIGRQNGYVITYDNDEILWKKIPVDNIVNSNSSNSIMNKAVYFALENKMPYPTDINLNKTYGIVRKYENYRNIWIWKEISNSSGGGSYEGTIDDYLSDTSTNPVQNKVITVNLNNKLNAPSSNGNNGQILFTHGNGNTYWGNAPSGGSITIDEELSNDSSNPVANWVITGQLSNKISYPNDYESGQFLQITGDGTVQWATISSGGASTAISVSITDNGNYYNSNSVQGALQEIGHTISNSITPRLLPDGGVTNTFLQKTSNGYAWTTISSSGQTIIISNSVTQGSNNAVSSGAVYTALQDKLNKPITTVNGFLKNTNGTLTWESNSSGGNLPNPPSGNANFVLSNIQYDEERENYWITIYDDYVELSGDEIYPSIYSTYAVNYNFLKIPDSEQYYSVLPFLQITEGMFGYDWGYIHNFDALEENPSTSYALTYSNNQYQFVPVTQSGGSGTANIDYLLFKIPKIQEDELLNFRIEFFNSEIQDNSTYNQLITTQTSNSKFAVFTGYSIIDFPQEGISSIFSGQVMRCDISNINSSNKYYRYQWWLNDGSNSTGSAFGYGQRDAIINVFDEKASPEQIVLKDNTHFESNNVEGTLYEIGDILDTLIQQDISNSGSNSKFTYDIIVDAPNIYHTEEGASLEDEYSYGFVNISGTYMFNSNSNTYQNEYGIVLTTDWEFLINDSDNCVSYIRINSNGIDFKNEYENHTIVQFDCPSHYSGNPNLSISMLIKKKYKLKVN